jgi:copper(I)-binding protein
MKVVLTIIGLAAVALAGCGSDNASQSSGVTVSKAWARTRAATQTEGAVYFEIESDQADTLVGVSVPAAVAGRAEIHEVVPGNASTMPAGSTDASMSSSDAMSGMDATMTMRKLEGGLPLPAGKTVTLAPGGYHVMLFDLAEPLAAGDTFSVTLTFANADQKTVTVTVSDTAP